MEQSTGVGVLDKIDLILTALQSSPLALADLARSTGLARPTVHRLASALERRGFVDRDPSGNYVLGPRIMELAAADTDGWLRRLSVPLLTDLRDTTGVSAQLFRRDRSSRLCLASVEPLTGLRDSVPAGTRLPMTAGSAAQVLLAWSEEPLPPAEAKFSAADLRRARSRGWAHSVAEREEGLASISAPVLDATGHVLAAVSLSGPISRIGRRARPTLVDSVVMSADSLARSVSGT